MCLACQTRVQTTMPSFGQLFISQGSCVQTWTEAKFTPSRSMAAKQGGTQKAMKQWAIQSSRGYFVATFVCSAMFAKYPFFMSPSESNEWSVYLNKGKKKTFCENCRYHNLCWYLCWWASCPEKWYASYMLLPTTLLPCINNHSSREIRFTKRCRFKTASAVAALKNRLCLPLMSTPDNIGMQRSYHSVLQMTDFKGCSAQPLSQKTTAQCT